MAVILKGVALPAFLLYLCPGQKADFAAGVYRAIQSKGRASLSPLPGTAVRTALAAPATLSAAGPRTRLTPRNCACRRPSGKSGNK